MLIQGLFRAKFKMQTLDGHGGGCWWLHRQSLGNALPVAILLKGVARITALDKLFLALVVKIILYVGEVHLNSVLKKKKIPSLTWKAASAALNHWIQLLHPFIRS